MTTEVSEGGESSSPPDQYTLDGIELPSAVEFIRKYPGMYVGTTKDTKHMVHWLLRDHAGAVENTEGARSLALRLLPDSGIEVTDNRPLSSLDAEDLHRRCTTFGDVHIPTVNALSSHFEVEEWANGESVRLEYKCGHRVGEPRRGEAPSGSGSRIRYTPDPNIFERTEVDPKWLIQRLEELAYLTSGARLTLQDGQRVRTFYEPDGLRSWVVSHVGRRYSIRRGVVRAEHARCEVAWAWSKHHEPQLRSWVNGVRSSEGGTHANALRRTLATAARSAAHNLIAAVHVNMPHPRYQSPIKSYLNSPEIAPLVRMAVQVANFDL